MIEDILKDEEFVDIMKAHAFDCLDFLLEKDINFSIMANLEFVSFNPPLPKEIRDKFKMPAIVFELGGYTLESSSLDEENEKFEFEAGFGENDFASVVTIPLNAIIQIFIENNPIFVNFSISEPKKDVKPKKRVFSLAD
ncbi:hypothetical protein CBLAS_0604 [Campylobacter blaseri]|uniref:Uncharacterized protein n=1 Tax=Campylobacter blaseri TaxID=2042961 RepID=A0A2P8R1X9_9BACT|nr:hypothetical protein [Campylobacter blaseri]PSM52500.1 hypothetical protein CQ405_01880 [Campylobacter blaseri]PSM54148.1 hypothetical protein CRN67_01880 [Campylobacter blaseri]QKF85796.1 hypothetical protein CBLAS_0604 [Campylobacter blaseri]